MRLSILLACSAVAFADTSAPPVRPPGLVAGWVLTRSRGDREERTGKTLDVVSGKLTRDGLAFEHGYAKLNDDAIGLVTGSMTLETWVRVDDLSSGWTCLVCRGSPGSGTGQSYGLYVSNAGSVYFTTLAASFQGPAGKIRKGEWAHVAVVVDDAARENRVYVDGECVVTRPAPEGGLKDRGGGFHIGGSDGQYRQGLTGVVRSVRVFDRAFEERQIRRMAKQRPQ